MSSRTAARSRVPGGRAPDHTTPDLEKTMTEPTVGPRCGNNPNVQLTDGDRKAVEDFKEYLANRAALGRVRAVLETEAVVGRSALEYRGLIASALMADETGPAAPAVVSAVPGQADNEDPARIDRLRPEFTEHSSIEAIDAQLQRAQSQERRWHLRTEWLISLRARRVAQKARGEWPAAGAQQDETCTNCRGSGLDPRYNGEFACPDCVAAAGAQQPKEA